MSKIKRAENRLTRTFAISCVCGLLLCSQSSCSLFDSPSKLENEPSTAAQKLLNPIGVSKDVVAVDFYRVRIRYEQRQLLEDFWNDDGTSDQMIPIDLRRRLAEEGIRIGVQGRSLSPSLARIRDIDKVQYAEATGKIAEQTAETQFAPVSKISSDEMLLEPLVNQQLLTLSALPGKSWTVYTYDDVLPQISLFWHQGGWCGKTYPKAQGTVKLSTVTYPDGTGIRFDLLPILEYGDPKQTSRMSNGAYIREIGRDKLIYDSLKISVKLLPGQWLVLGPTGPNPPGLGKHFFTRNREQPEQKIMIFRLSDGGNGR